MKIKKNGKVITLNESDLKRIVKRILTEQEEEYTPPSFWDEFSRGASYIWDDIKDAASEIPEIPDGFGKLGDMLTSKSTYKEIAKGFEAMGDEISDAASEVSDFFTGLFNEQRLHEESGSLGSGPIDKLLEKIKDPKKRRMAKKWLKQMKDLINPNGSLLRRIGKGIKKFAKNTVDANKRNFGRMKHALRRHKH